jgi:hypothetical protein
LSNFADKGKVLLSQYLNIRTGISVAIAFFAAATPYSTVGAQQTSSAAPSSMRRLGTVHARFQSSNVEMVEITGGRFWRPFGKQVDAMLAGQASAKQSGSDQPFRIDPNLFCYRPPIDLTNPRLRQLAAARRPAYVRISGRWQHSTYFQNTDVPATQTAPKGFNSVLPRQEWKGVIEFAHAVNATIITSFATSMNTRDAAGLWTTDQAAQSLAYTNAAGGSIAATEYMNELTFAGLSGAPKEYDAAAYAQDVAVFPPPFIRKATPDMVTLTAHDLLDETVDLNDRALNLNAGDALPLIRGTPT